ncbi:DUF5685 family protein [Antrihabitans sp. YC2-6]|uniref:DUF5685 family protein n=1 Tax=Antrihabitans sp. YC2-6 TaxID=2799498 RepID=UPI0018F298BF|nr:DUF5685 family protein [Antrihabitans sp. YC2-6]MBJ8346321.1 hypothetical protein [Antrihabitans sp. YC2-6]
MFGIVRPCRHRLSEGLRTQWMSHLCGLCLALRDDHGQFARVATNYDGLIISLLVEAQSEQSGAWRRKAGPCPLRGMRTASVAQGEGARLAAAVSLVLASAKVRDHIADHDGILGRKPVAAAARRVATNWNRAGGRIGSDLGFDTAVLVDAVDRQTVLESSARVGTSLLTITEPTETATAAAFGHTAILAGRPGNIGPLQEAGRLFGRLAHLLDAVEDRRADAASGAWNPITATGADLAEARRLCDDATTGITLALRDVEFVDPRLTHLLLAHELQHSVDRAFGTHGHEIGATNQPPWDPNQPWDKNSPYEAPPIEQQPFGGAQGQYPQTAPGSQPPEPPDPPRRNFFTGCGIWSWQCCTCQLCCRDPYEGAWDRKKKQGWCRGQSSSSNSNDCCCEVACCGCCAGDACCDC